MASAIIYELWAFIEKQESDKGRKLERKKSVPPRTECIYMHVETHVIILPVAVAGDDVNATTTEKKKMAQKIEERTNERNCPSKIHSEASGWSKR